MNSSQDIFQTFFTLQKPRVKTDSDDNDKNEVILDLETATTTMESSYDIYEPSGNWFVGVYIMLIG